MKVVACEMFSSYTGTGIAVMTAANRIYVINSVEDPRIRRLAEITGTHDPRKRRLAEITGTHDPRIRRLVDTL